MTRLLHALLPLLVLGALATAPGVAHAKNGDVKMVGIDSVDDVLKQVKKLDNLVDDASKQRTLARDGLNTALGLKKGTPLDDALNDLRKKAAGKVKVVSRGGQLALEPTDAVPANVKQGIDALNNAFTGYTSAIISLKDVPGEAVKLKGKCQKLPKKFKKEVLGGNPLKIIKSIKKVGVLKDDVKIALELPKRTAKVTKGLNSDMGMMVGTFGGSWPPKVGN